MTLLESSWPQTMGINLNDYPASFSKQLPQITEFLNSKIQEGFQQDQIAQYARELKDTLSFPLIPCIRLLGDFNTSRNSFSYRQRTRLTQEQAKFESNRLMHLQKLGLKPQNADDKTTQSSNSAIQSFINKFSQSSNKDQPKKPKKERHSRKSSKTEIPDNQVLDTPNRSQRQSETKDSEPSTPRTSGKTKEKGKSKYKMPTVDYWPFGTTMDSHSKTNMFPQLQEVSFEEDPDRRDIALRVEREKRRLEVQRKRLPDAVTKPLPSVDLSSSSSSDEDWNKIQSKLELKRSVSRSRKNQGDITSTRRRRRARRDSDDSNDQLDVSFDIHRGRSNAGSTQHNLNISSSRGAKGIDTDETSSQQSIVSRESSGALSAQKNSNYPDSTSASKKKTSSIQSVPAMLEEIQKGARTNDHAGVLRLPPGRKAIKKKDTKEKERKQKAREERMRREQEEERQRQIRSEEDQVLTPMSFSGFASIVQARKQVSEFTDDISDQSEEADGRRRRTQSKAAVSRQKKGTTRHYDDRDEVSSMSDQSVSEFEQKAIGLNTKLPTWRDMFGDESDSLEDEEEEERRLKKRKQEEEERARLALERKKREEEEAAEREIEAQRLALLEFQRLEALRLQKEEEDRREEERRRREAIEKADGEERTRLERELALRLEQEERDRKAREEAERLRQEELDRLEKLRLEELARRERERQEEEEAEEAERRRRKRAEREAMEQKEREMLEGEMSERDYYYMKLKEMEEEKKRKREEEERLKLEKMRADAEYRRQVFEEEAKKKEEEEKKLAMSKLQEESELLEQLRKRKREGPTKVNKKKADKVTDKADGEADELELTLEDGADELDLDLGDDEEELDFDLEEEEEDDALDKEIEKLEIKVKSREQYPFRVFYEEEEDDVYFEEEEVPAIVEEEIEFDEDELIDEDEINFDDEQADIDLDDDEEKGKPLDVEEEVVEIDLGAAEEMELLFEEEQDPPQLDEVGYSGEGIGEQDNPELTDSRKLIPKNLMEVDFKWVKKVYGLPDVDDAGLRNLFEELRTELKGDDLKKIRHADTMFTARFKFRSVAAKIPWIDDSEMVYLIYDKMGPTPEPYTTFLTFTMSLLARQPGTHEAFIKSGTVEQLGWFIVQPNRAGQAILSIAECVAYLSITKEIRLRFLEFGALRYFQMIIRQYRKIDKYIISYASAYFGIIAQHIEDVNPDEMNAIIPDIISMIDPEIYPDEDVQRIAMMVLAGLARDPLFVVRMRQIKMQKHAIEQLSVNIDNDKSILINCFAIMWWCSRDFVLVQNEWDMPMLAELFGKVNTVLTASQDEKLARWSMIVMAMLSGLPKAIDAYVENGIHHMILKIITGQLDHWKGCTLKAPLLVLRKITGQKNHRSVVAQEEGTKYLMTLLPEQMKEKRTDIVRIILGILSNLTGHDQSVRIVDEWNIIPFIINLLFQYYESNEERTELRFFQQKPGFKNPKQLAVDYEEKCEMLNKQSESSDKAEKPEEDDKKKKKNKEDDGQASKKKKQYSLPTGSDAAGILQCEEEDDGTVPPDSRDIFAIFPDEVTPEEVIKPQKTVDTAVPITPGETMTVVRLAAQIIQNLLELPSQNQQFRDLKGIDTYQTYIKKLMDDSTSFYQPSFLNALATKNPSIRVINERYEARREDRKGEKEINAATEEKLEKTHKAVVRQVPAATFVDDLELTLEALIRSLEFAVQKLPDEAKVQMIDKKTSTIVPLLLDVMKRYNRLAPEGVMTGKKKLTEKEMKDLKTYGANSASARVICEACTMTLKSLNVPSGRMTPFREERVKAKELWPHSAIFKRDT
ncbi:hypothetical protein BLNAU_2932 [Blattamonas nauphoetae]|uniref:Uncharacterized protein n=1 Tax=Blattamonas nauphoetae TaxID=2049346 RepID=A0ABQ9YEU8_9EUKA|nr:hypothetical protein BLNAU_2932 [Blattamonas nauphoetae]